MRLPFLCQIRALLACVLVLTLALGVQDVLADANSYGSALEIESELSATVVESVVSVSAAADDGDHPSPPLFLVIPFAALLLMIATGPLFYPHHWHHHFPKYALGLGLLTATYYLAVLHSFTPILHAMEEYFAFIALLGALYIASSGILINVNRKGTAAANSVLLLFGSVIANVIGTTGASMLLIRPFMRLNKGRCKPYHIIFFIFTVSNVGGALTPIGDPPLFLGFLRGVEFFWTLTEIWYIWLPTILLIIAIFYVVDSRNKVASTAEFDSGAPMIQITGGKNFIWLALIVACVFVDPNVISAVPRLHFGDIHLPFGIREIAMFAICFFSFKYASKAAMSGNEFNFEPIREVAWLFVGIFLTMQPALELIRVWASTNAASIGVSTFYWGTGALSGVLDNAPTYVSFLSAAMGKFGLDVNSIVDVRTFMNGVESAEYLKAISVASVFFGAMTYIGNGPNFMVKAIAESSGINCPSFVGYVVKYSIVVLLPVYFVVWVVFFSGMVF